MKYPINCNTARRKTEYLYKAQEELRLLHNVFSQWHHKGKLTPDQYNSLPKVFREKYIYVSNLPELALDKFMKEDFTPRSNRICQEICVQRAELKKSSEWHVDVGEV